MAGTSFRIDRGGLQKPVKLDNGWLRVDAYLTRTGVFEYVDENGNARLEYRPESTVFDPSSLKSFEAVPLTNDHPPAHLDASNTSRYQVGHAVGAPVREGDKMRASILVTDAKTIADMEGGKVEISNGYFCECDETPGATPDGERYDAIQRNVVGNHIALVDQGRAGPTVRARVDAAAGRSRFDGTSARMLPTRDVLSAAASSGSTHSALLAAQRAAADSAAAGMFAHAGSARVDAEQGVVAQALAAVRSTGESSPHHVVPLEAGINGQGAYERAAAEAFKNAGKKKPKAKTGLEGFDPRGSKPSLVGGQS